MDISAMLEKIKENPKDLKDLVRMLQAHLSADSANVDGFLKMLREHIGNADFEAVVYTVWSTRKLEERREANKQRVHPL